MMPSSQDERKLDECLVRRREPVYRGGTLIAEDVVDLDAHYQRLEGAKSYRPAECPRCFCHVLHVHDYPSRVCPDRAPILIVRYRCANPKCRAIWRILPAFLPRHLHRSWLAIERAVNKDKPAASLGLPATSVRRWRSRLASPAKHLVVLFATYTGTLLEAIAKAAGLGSTREEFVKSFRILVQPPKGQRLSVIAGLAHRLERGVRLV